MNLLFRDLGFYEIVGGVIPPPWFKALVLFLFPGVFRVPDVVGRQLPIVPVAIEPCHSHMAFLPGVRHYPHVREGAYHDVYVPPVLSGSHAVDEPEG